MLTPRRSVLALGLAALAFAAPALAADEDPFPNITVKAEPKGEGWVIDMQAKVAAPVADTWAVLTDFERMPQMLPENVKVAKVLSRSGNKLEVEQTTETRFAFLRFNTTSVRAIELTPQKEIRSNLVRGDFKAFASSTKFVDDGNGGTLITYHNEFTPMSSGPQGIVQKAIVTETKKQYGALFAEAIKRSKAGGTAAAPAKAASGG